MCTVFCLPSLRLLSKNRDKETDTDEEIFDGDSVLGIRTLGADYYSIALNRHGVAFASTAVNSVEWTQAVEDGRASEAKTIMAVEREGRTSPTVLLSRHFDRIASTADALALFGSANESWMGYNVILMDSANAIVVEFFDDQHVDYAFDGLGVVTNHFKHLKHGAEKEADYPSSFQRRRYAERRIGDIKSLDDLEEAANPKRASDADEIWRDGAFKTVSSAIVDANGLSLWRSEISGGSWRRYKLR